MQEYKRGFLDFAVACGVLRFGQFTLKSGRLSPYFFDTGRCCSGAHLAHLGRSLAHAIQSSGIHYDMLFGLAYKGIPLVTALALALSRDYGRDVAYAFNRKEAKDHGEGGLVVGAKLSGEVLIVDDVISAGTSVREALQIMKRADARPAGVVVALDRQERGQESRSAIQKVMNATGCTGATGVPLVSIVTLNDLVDYLQLQPGMQKVLEDIRRYRHRYGAAPS
jgi:orotate phosphoribosyltransferase